ncbi:MAG TPA: VCBS repeat-containing protein [Planctomycetota bacterium]|nr:VCBS repeat-containing protein [Planctomycetota bacterium]
MRSRLDVRTGCLAAAAVVVLLLMGCKFHKAKICPRVGAPALTGLGASKAAWGDFDKDGDLDVVIAGSTTTGSPTPTTKFYRNNGSGGFTEVTGANFLDVTNADLCWVDLDNDGFIDLILCGTDAAGNPKTHIYQNNGNGTFTDKGNCGLPDIQSGTIRSADSNHDGLFDLAAMGDDGTSLVAEVFYNSGNFTFFNVGAGITPVLGTLDWTDIDNSGTWGLLVTGTPDGIYDDSLVVKFYWDISDGWSSIDVTSDKLTGTALTLGDFNNDGLVDFAVAGYDDSSAEMARVYFNNGSSFFTDVGAGLTAAANGSVACGDFNADGFLDLVVMGQPSNVQSQVQTILYFGDGNGVFTDSGELFTGANSGCVAAADYNRNTRLDFILMGINANGAPFAELVSNTAAPANTRPTAPISLFTSVSGSDVTIFWGSNSDDHTPVAALTYNVRVGSSAGADDMLPAHANGVNGFRRIVGPGNGSRGNSLVLRNLPDGTYFYSVQAIDGMWEGGDWATENTFTIFSGAIRGNGPGAP